MCCHQLSLLTCHLQRTANLESTRLATSGQLFPIRRTVLTLFPMRWLTPPSPPYHFVSFAPTFSVLWSHLYISFHRNRASTHISVLPCPSAQPTLTKRAPTLVILSPCQPTKCTPFPLVCLWQRGLRASAGGAGRLRKDGEALQRLCALRGALQGVRPRAVSVL